MPDTGLPYPEEQPMTSMGPQSSGQEVEVSPGFQGQHDGTLIRWQLEFGDILESIERKLKGEVFDINIGQWKEGLAGPMVNNRGVAAIMQIVGVYLNKGAVLSHIKEQDANEMTLNIVSAIIDLLELKYQEYEIDKAHLQTIVDLVEGYVFCSLSRAKDGTTLKFLKSTEKHIESYSNNAEKKPGAIWSFFNKAGGGLKV